jgi:sulfur transfer complex TusBCD TusB component (DsrH family)
MSLFSRFEAIAEGVAHSAHGILVKIFGSDAITKFEGEVQTIFQEDVLVIFQDGIALAESLKTPEGGAPATGAEKRSAAFLKISEDLKAKGISLADHVINLGIELVVGFVKAKTPAAAASAGS